MTTKIADIRFIDGHGCDFGERTVMSAIFAVVGSRGYSMQVYLWMQIYMQHIPYKLYIYIYKYITENDAIRAPVFEDSIFRCFFMY